MSVIHMSDIEKCFESNLVPLVILDIEKDESKDGWYAKCSDNIQHHPIDLLGRQRNLPFRFLVLFGCRDSEFLSNKKKYWIRQLDGIAKGSNLLDLLKSFKHTLDQTEQSSLQYFACKYFNLIG
jgi:hypothetical protein